MSINRGSAGSYFNLRRGKRRQDSDLEWRMGLRTSVDEMVAAWRLCVQDAGLGCTPPRSSALSPLSAWSAVESGMGCLLAFSADFWEEDEQGMSTCGNLQQGNPRRVIAGAQGSWSSSDLPDLPFFTASISSSRRLSAPPFSSISLGLYLSPVWIPWKQEEPSDPHCSFPPFCPWWRPVPVSPSPMLPPPQVWVRFPGDASVFLSLRSWLLLPRSSLLNDQACTHCISFNICNNPVSQTN